MLEQGIDLLLRGFAQEIEPAIGDMRQTLREMEPQLQELMRLVDDLGNYESPRRLENGDILIPRRKDPLSSPPIAAPEIEL